MKDRKTAHGAVKEDRNMRKKRVRMTAVLLAGLMLCAATGCSDAVETAGWGTAQTAEQDTESIYEKETPQTELEETGTFPVSEEAAGTETESGQEAAAEEFAAKDRPKVRGIYVTGPMAGTANMDRLIDLVDRTELNALVIDVKNDEGWVVCDMEVPLLDEIGSVKRYVKDMTALVQKCKEKGIYLIARIVAFKDPLLAKAKPEWCLHNADGSIFRDKSGLAWVNPYEKQVWDYLLSVAEGAVGLGFDEVQFDYIRFSTDSGMRQVDFGPQAENRERTDVITEFAAYVAEPLHAMGAAVSADVYGVVIDSRADQQIVGQDYFELAQYLDYLSPMVYPSHYGPYNYNIPVPDAQPYDTVLAAMLASKREMAGLNRTQEAGQISGNDADKIGISDNDGSDGSVSGNGVSDNDVLDGGRADDISVAAMRAEETAALEPAAGVRAKVRPWLQDFTASWVRGHIKYGPKQIREQIQAVYDAGYEEWILWNAANRYTEGGLYGPDGELPKEEEQPVQEETSAAETQQPAAETQPPADILDPAAEQGGV